MQIQQQALRRKKSAGDLELASQEAEAWWIGPGLLLPKHLNDRWREQRTQMQTMKTVLTASIPLPLLRGGEH